MIPHFLQALPLPEIKAEKGIQLLKEGDVCRNIYIVTSGIVRLYFTYRRKELTTQFFFAGDAATSVHSFLQGSRSASALDVIEDCRLLVLSKELYKDLMETDKAFREWFYQSTVQIEFAHSCHLQDVMQRRAQDRFRQMESERPHWLSRIEPRYLASYLGITKVAFHQARTYDARRIVM